MIKASFLSKTFVYRALGGLARQRLIQEPVEVHTSQGFYRRMQWVLPDAERDQILNNPHFSHDPMSNVVQQNEGVTCGHDMITSDGQRYKIKYDTLFQHDKQFPLYPGSTAANEYIMSKVGQLAGASVQDTQFARSPEGHLLSVHPMFSNVEPKGTALEKIQTRINGETNDMGERIARMGQHMQEAQSHPDAVRNNLLMDFLSLQDRHFNNALLDHANNREYMIDGGFNHLSFPPSPAFKHNLNSYQQEQVEQGIQPKLIDYELNHRLEQHINDARKGNQEKIAQQTLYRLATLRKSDIDRIIDNIPHDAKFAPGYEQDTLKGILRLRRNVARNVYEKLYGQLEPHEYQD